MLGRSGVSVFPIPCSPPRGEDHSSWGIALPKAGMVILFVITVALTTGLPFVQDSAWAAPRSLQERFDLPSQPDEVLEKILQGKEFAESSWRKQLDILLERLKRLLDSFLKWLSDKTESTTFVAPDFSLLWTISACLLAGAVGLIIVYVLAMVAPNLFDRLSLMTLGKAGDSESVGGDIGADELREQARVAADGGRYAEAVVLLFRYCLVWMDERGRLVLQKGKTNREILNSLPKNDPVAGVLDQMVLIFNRVRYGTGDCKKADLDRFLDLLRRVTGES